MRILSFILLIILLPFFVIISILIMLFMGFPVFFIQKRIGKDKKEFKIYKFRTMKNEEITSLGKILRKLGIDELPQLVNILKGKMAFVGPRPLTEFDIKRLKWHTKYHTIRWKVKPGITGMAQLSNVCNVKISWFYDKYYVENKNICLDLSILFKSAIIPLIGKKSKITK